MRELVMDAVPAAAGQEWLPRLAHDLRGPLAPLKVAGQMLQEGDLPLAGRREVGKAIARQTQLLQQLADDLDDILRIGHGAFRVDPQSCNLETVAANAAVEAMRRSRMRGHDSRAVPVRLTADPIFVHADERRITQLIAQMIGAIASTANDEGRCWIECERTPGEAIVRLHDDGGRIYRGASIEYLAHGTVPEDPGVLGMSAVIGRAIVMAHSAIVEIVGSPDGMIAELALRIPMGAGTPH